jgi:PadR family transcriptional regulator, regulatory protein PadR
VVEARAELTAFVVLDKGVAVGYPLRMARLRLTQATLAVVGVLMAAGPDDQVWGLRLCEEANLGSGTVYPLLERLERAGIVTSFWEDPQPANRPRRRFYELTSSGRQEIAAAVVARSTARGRWLPGVAQAGDTG